jgi:hypothetical protein
MAKFNVTGEQHFSITGQMLEIHRQIRLKSGSPIDPKLISLALQNIIEGRFNKKNKKENEISRLLSKGESIIIDACDGTETLAKAKETFKSGIDSEFKDWGTDKPSKETGETAVLVCEAQNDSTFVQLFGSLGNDLDKLCLTQHQIKNFCKKHSNWLRTEGYSTFFLFKVDEQFFVALVHINSSNPHSDGLLHLRLRRFGYDRVWDATFYRRVVIPQLTV